MVGKAERIIPRGERTWLVRIFMGWDFGTGEAQIRQQDDPWQLRDVQAYLSPKRAGSPPRGLLRTIPDESRWNQSLRSGSPTVPYGAHSRTTCRRRQ